MASFWVAPPFSMIDTQLMWTTGLLAYAITLVIGVLLSDLASRTLLSMAVLFLATGFVLGSGILGAVPLTPDAPLVREFVELALVAVLFSDGMRVTADTLRSQWQLPGRALFIGMPLTVVITALLAHYVAAVPWVAAWLVGAALSPTDPVFARALVGNRSVPGRVQHLLNVESGVNDGIALPMVMTLLVMAGARGESASVALLETGAGVAVGAAVAFAVIRVESLQIFGASREYRPLAGFAIGLLVFATSKTIGVNEFLGAFTAGVAITALAPAVADAFEQFGDMLAELLKLAGVMAFGALLSHQLHAGFGILEWSFALAALILARPLALAPALILTPLSWRERATVAWFGPKGFASVFFGILILSSGVPQSERLFRLVALVVAASIIAHSSTDVLVVRWLERAGDHNDQP